MKKRIIKKERNKGNTNKYEGIRPKPTYKKSNKNDT